MNCLILLAAVVSAQDVQREMNRAYEILKPAVEKGEKLIEAGKLDEANQALLDFFPQATRTPAQALLLGNLMFGNSPKVSYALHKFAAEKLPDSPDAQLEWAMQQHRAGEYAGAAVAYAKYSAAVPDYAPAWGLAADCLIRLGKVREAIAAWESSEKAKDGTLERFESMVCEVYTKDSPLQRRQALRAAMTKGDLDAAAQLIALDCSFPRDWWNNGPSKPYLESDLAALRAAKFPVGRRIDAIFCAADVGLAKEDDAEGLDALLRRRGFILDADHSLPDDAAIAAFLIDRAFALDLLKGPTRKAVAGKVLATARKTGDRLLWNAALGLTEDDQESLEKEGWEATKDARFAAAYLLILERNKRLKGDNPILADALKEHPESALLNRLALVTAGRENRTTQELLVRAIQAEYRRFSVSGLNPRPRAATLRIYFKQLAKLSK